MQPPTQQVFNAQEMQSSPNLVRVKARGGSKQLNGVVLEPVAHARIVQNADQTLRVHTGRQELFDVLTQPSPVGRLAQHIAPEKLGCQKIHVNHGAGRHKLVDIPAQHSHIAATLHQLVRIGTSSQKLVKIITHHRWANLLHQTVEVDLGASRPQLVQVVGNRPRRQLTNQPVNVNLGTDLPQLVQVVSDVLGVEPDSQLVRVRPGSQQFG